MRPYASDTLQSVRTYRTVHTSMMQHLLDIRMHVFWFRVDTGLKQPASHQKQRPM